MPDLGSVANSWIVRHPNRSGQQRLAVQPVGGLQPTPPTVARLGTLAGWAGPLPISATPHVFAIPATIAATNTILIAGWADSPVAITISDTQGNTWTPRGPAPGTTIFLFECQVTQPLHVSDTITVTPSGTLNWGLIGAWYSQCYFDQIATVSTWTGTAATAGTITTKVGGGPVLGIYGGYNNAGTTPPAITAAASGYTVEPGGVFGAADGTVFGAADGSLFGSAASTVGSSTANAIGWISKNGAGGVSETPSATVAVSGAIKQGAAVSYSLIPTVFVALNATGGTATTGGAVTSSGGILFPIPDEAIMAPMMAV